MGAVQAKAGAATGTTLTLTLDQATGGGSPGTYSVNGLTCVIAASGTSANPTSITVDFGSGDTDNWVQKSTFGSSSDAAIGATWDDMGSAAGKTSVRVTCAGGSGTIALMATVYERDDFATGNPFDKTANSVSSGSTSWTSTATPTTTQASEVAFGAVFCTESAGGTITGPSSPWVNISQVSLTQGSFQDRWMTGYDELAATQAVTYNGTVSPSQQWIAKAVTYKLGIPPVFAHDTQTLGPAGTDNTTTGSYTTTGAQTALSHAASPYARAAVVCITQTVSAADQVSGVTYGGAAMTRLRRDTESTEAGAVYIYWLDGIATGTQNVVLTTSGSDIKKMVVSTMTASPGATVAVAGHNTGTSASVSNPSWTITGLTASSKLEAYECIHSGLQAMTATPAASWTLQESLDEGATGRGFARQEVASSGTSLTCGWTAATADDFVGSSVAFIEVTTTTVTGDVALALTSAVTAAGTSTVLGAAAVAETAAVTASGTSTRLAAAAVAETATITAAGIGTRLAAASVAATAVITATGTATESAAAAVAATAAVTAAGTSTVLGAAAASTTCTITATAAIGGTTVSGDAALSVTDTITAAGTVTALAAAAVSTTAAITASGTGTDLAAATIPVTATITASGTGTRLAAAAVAETATITAAGTVTALAAAAVTGTATITAAGTGTRLAAATIPVTATITATATVGAAPVSADAALALTAAVTAAGTKTGLGAAAVTGTATVTAAGTLSPAAAAAAVSAAAAVTSAATVTARGAAAVTTTAAITATAEIPLPFTIGALTAPTAPTGALTAAGASSALTAATAPGSTLTAGTTPTGGPS